MERNVFFSVKVRNGLLQLFHHVDVTVDGYRRVIYVYCLFHFFYFFVHCTEQGTHFRLFSEYPFQKKFGRDQCKFEHQFLVLLKSQSTEFCDVGVQFFGSPVLSLAASFGGIPLFWQNASLYSGLFVMPVNGYTHKNGCLTVFQKFCLQNEEQDVHCSLFHTRFLLVVGHVLLCQPERGGRDVFSVFFLFEGYENHRIFPGKPSE